MAARTDWVDGETVNAAALNTLGAEVNRILGRDGAAVHLVYRNSRWETPAGTVPDLAGRIASITWEGTGAQIPAQGTGAADFRVGDVAMVRTAAL